MLVDRYLLRRILRPFAGILACVVAILLLDNLGRLLDLLKYARDPGSLLLRFSLYLLPEYLGIGILLALFLSVAIAVRALSGSGEWQILAATGLSPARVSVIPLLLGLCCATAELGIHLHFRPAGEYALDRLITDIRNGLYGLGGEDRALTRIDGDTMITADRFDPVTGQLENVFVSRKATVFSAPRAHASYDGAGRIDLLLEDGQSVMRGDDGRLHALRFVRMHIDLRHEDAGSRRSIATTLDRLSYGALMRRVRSEAAAGVGRRSALASLASRCSYGAVALLLPFLGVALGALPPRGRTPYGIAAGILAIVGFIRMSAYVEGAAVAFPLTGFSLLIGLCAAGVLIVWRAEERHGPGFVESWLATRLASPLVKVMRRRSRSGP